VVPSSSTPSIPASFREPRYGWSASSSSSSPRSRRGVSAAAIVLAIAGDASCAGAQASDLLDVKRTERDVEGARQPCARRVPRQRSAAARARLGLPSMRARPSPASRRFGSARTTSGAAQAWSTVRCGMTFKDQCRTYDGPATALTSWLRARRPTARTGRSRAGSGTVRIVGSRRGPTPSGPGELHVSHWTGALAHLELYADWAFHGDAHDIFGRMTYGGCPYTVSTRPWTARDDSYGRSLYIDTFDRPMGSAGNARRRSSFAGPSGRRSVTRSGRRTMSRRRGEPRGRPATARSTASASSGRASPGRDRRDARPWVLRPARGKAAGRALHCR